MNEKSKSCDVLTNLHNHMSELTVVRMKRRRRRRRQVKREEKNK